LAIKWLCMLSLRLPLLAMPLRVSDPSRRATWHVDRAGVSRSHGAWLRDRVVKPAGHRRQPVGTSAVRVTMQANAVTGAVPWVQQFRLRILYSRAATGCIGGTTCSLGAE